MQGHWHYGRKCIRCSYPRPLMWFRFIKSGHKWCSNGDSSKYAHPKICRSSLLSHMCGRVKCYFYRVTGTGRPNINIYLLRADVPKRPVPRPTPLIHIRLPPSSPSHPLATDTLASAPHKSPMTFTKLYNVAASSKTPEITSSFLDQMKEPKLQMIQMQQPKTVCWRTMWSKCVALIISP